MTDAAMRVDVPGQFAQARGWRPFLDPSVEASYRAWHRHQTIPLARIIGIGSAVVWAFIPIWYRLSVGDVPRALYVSNWAIVVPALLAAVAASYTRLQRWMVLVVSLANVIIGLDIVWIMSLIYGPTSGLIVCGSLAFIFYPVVLRVPAGAAALVAIAIGSVPMAVFFSEVSRGNLSFADSWPYLALLVPTMGMVVLAAAVIEGSMRQQFAAQGQLQASQRLLRRYAPAAVAERIVSGDAEAVGRPQRTRVTALSSDVAGFTALADQLDPESLSHIIDEYVGSMSDVVEGHGGVVTEFAGDGLMAVFGAPEQLEPEDQVRRALAAADAMHARLDELNTSWFLLGIERPLLVRIGINTGVLSVGTFGSDGRGTYTAIGLQMNIAARIQAECVPGRTLLSSSSWHLVKDTVECEPLGEVEVKGVHFPISIYAPKPGAVSADAART